MIFDCRFIMSASDSIGLNKFLLVRLQKQYTMAKICAKLFKTSMTYDKVMAMTKNNKITDKQTDEWLTYIYSPLVPTCRGLIITDSENSVNVYI